MTVKNCFTISFGIALAATCSAEILTFDDLSDNQQWHSTPMSSGYGGFQWTNWLYYSWDNPPYNAASGSTRLRTPPATLNAVQRDGGFIFHGAKFSGLDWPIAPKGVQFQLYRNGTRVHFTEFLWLLPTPQLLSSGYSGVVDYVTVTGDYAFAVMDDFEWSAAPPQPRVIPGTLTVQDVDNDGQWESIGYTLTNGTETFSGAISVPPSGTVAMTIDVPESAPFETYSIFFKGGTFLGRTFLVDLTGGPVAPLAVSLPNGDIDQDGEVSVSDYAILSAAFGETADADLNNDSETDIADYAILSANYGQVDE